MHVLAACCRGATSGWTGAVLWWLIGYMQPGTHVFLHGFTGAPSSWAATCQALGGAMQHITLPGHAPDIPLCATFEDTCQYVTQQLRAVNAPVHLVGYSLGARVALGMALQAPDIVQSLTLVGVNPGLESDEARRERMHVDATWIRLLKANGIAAFVDAWEKQPIFASQQSVDADAIRAQHETRLAHDPLGLAASLRAAGLASMPNYWPRLRMLGLPVHLVVGEQDAKFSAIAARASERIPHARTTTLPRCGHNPLLEAPSALAAALQIAHA